MEQQQIDISSYLKVLQRRKWAFILPAVLIFGIAVAVAFSLPAVYRSEATILVEAQEIPEEMVQSTVTGYVEERIQAINQVVLSRANLLEIIEENDLYRDLRRTSTTEEVVTKMRDDISMTPVQAEVSNPESGRTGMATIAFTLAYENRHPRKAVQVANTLVSLFLEENAKQREEKAETTVTFLEKQQAQLDRQIAELERRIAEFKEKNQLALPEIRDLNIQMLHRLEDRIDANRQDIKTLKDRKIYLQGQLAGLEPSQNLSSEQLLEQLRNEYVSKKASLSPKHPDVISLKKSVEALESELEVKDSLRRAREGYNAARAELATLRDRYSKKHPDVVKQRKAVQELQARIEKLKKKQAALEVEEPDNPAYINIRTQIRTTEMDLESARNDLKDLKRKHAKIQDRIERTPKVEQRYEALQRDYQNSKAKYQDISARLLRAREAKDLESNRMAQKLTLIDPPVVPEQPAKPNRLALLLVGCVLSAGFGVGTGSLSEFLDSSVHSPRDVTELTEVPLLTAIPYLETSEDRRARWVKRIVFLAGVILLGVCGLAAVHFMFRPLDVIWIQVQQKLQFMI